MKKLLNFHILLLLLLGSTAIFQCICPPAAMGGALPPESPDRRTCEETCENTFSIGARVAAMWEDGNYYLATVTGMEKKGDKTLYNIKYQDGMHGQVERDGLLEILPEPLVEEGDIVLAVWARDRFYKGVVLEKRKGGALIRWDDGSTPGAVESGKIIRLGTFEKGMRVAVRWKDGRIYPGQVLARISASHRKPVFLINLKNGETGEVEASDLISLPSRPAFMVGEKVMALSSCGYFRPARIVSIEKDIADVVWEDGGKPEKVSAGDMFK